MQPALRTIRRPCWRKEASWSRIPAVMGSGFDNLMDACPDGDPPAPPSNAQLRRRQLNEAALKTQGGAPAAMNGAILSGFPAAATAVAAPRSPVLHLNTSANGPANGTPERPWKLRCRPTTQPLLSHPALQARPRQDDLPLNKVLRLKPTNGTVLIERR